MEYSASAYWLAFIWHKGAMVVPAPHPPPLPLLRAVLHSSLQAAPHCYTNRLRGYSKWRRSSRICWSKWERGLCECAFSIQMEVCIGKARRCGGRWGRRPTTGVGRVWRWHLCTVSTFGWEASYVHLTEKTSNDKKFGKTDPTERKSGRQTKNFQSLMVFTWLDKAL